MSIFSWVAVFIIGAISLVVSIEGESKDDNEL
jgi:hypothetical protein